MRRIVADISTHTLTWSVTWHGKECSPCGFHFNSHAHVERDYTTGAGTAIVFNFNSHAHVERDHFGRCKNCKYFYFNSHAHVERDGNVLDFVLLSRISTHTLTWSVTVTVAKVDLSGRFQLTRSRGA